MTAAPSPSTQPITHAIYFEVTGEEEGGTSCKSEFLVIGATPMIPNGFGTVVHREVSTTRTGHWNIYSYMHDGAEIPKQPSRPSTPSTVIGPTSASVIVNQMNKVVQAVRAKGGRIVSHVDVPTIALLQVSYSEFLELDWGSSPHSGVRTPYKLLSRAQDAYDATVTSLPGTTLSFAKGINAEYDAWYTKCSEFVDSFSGKDILVNALGYLMASGFSMDIFNLLDSQVAPFGKLGVNIDLLAQDTTREDQATVNEYTRPNGEIYYSRQWTGVEDVEVLLTARTHNQYPLMYGPPGTGKTALAEAAFGPELITLVITGDTEVSDLVGQFIPNPNYGVPGDTNGEYLWVDGPLTTAVVEGRPFLLDEIGLADPKMLSVIYPLMDGRRQLHVSMNPNRGTLQAADGFFLMATTNPNEPGVVVSGAVRSRFNMHVEVLTDWALAVTKLDVPENIVGIAQGLAKLVTSGESSWAPQMRELLTFKKQYEVYGESFAVSNLLAACPEEDRDIVQERVRRIYKSIPTLPARIGQS